ncbi:hypothetical protein BB559_007441, partial [Furculomyces boomerangus]
MNLVHTISDEGIDKDTILKLTSDINIAKDKVLAFIEGRSTKDTSDKETMTTRIRDINKLNNENNQKKVSFADTIKRNTKTNDNKKIPQKTVSRKPIVFTKDQMLKVINGKSLFESTKYRLVYFEGIQRCRVIWANQLLLQSGIKAYQLGNVYWVTDTKLEVCINEKAAPQLVKHMDTIKGITYNSIYNPIAAKKGKQSGLDQLKARLKWQTSDANRNKPAQRMARLVTKITEMNTMGSAIFPGTPWFQKTTSITTSDSRTDFIGRNVGNNNTGAGRSDKLIICNAPKLKAKTVINAILMRTQLRWSAFKKELRTRTKSENIGIKEELNEYLCQKKPSILALQETWLTKKTSRWCIPGYICIEDKSSLTKEGTGLLIGVKSSSCLKISELRDNTQWMAAKVYGAF